MACAWNDFGGYFAGTFELQLMRMICEKKPRIAAKLIMDDKKIIKEFFAGIFTWNLQIEYAVVCKVNKIRLEL